MEESLLGGEETFTETEVRISVCGDKVPGMNSVIATITGYAGSERSHLIKLINLSGGLFVGKLRRTTTHLVCWKFEGEKYELAKKWGTVIINHQWFEDCMKTGKRLPEEPYMSSCGVDVGGFMWRAPITERISACHFEVESQTMLSEDNSTSGYLPSFKQPKVPKSSRLRSGQRTKRKEEMQGLATSSRPKSAECTTSGAMLASIDLTLQDGVSFLESKAIQADKMRSSKFEIPNNTARLPPDNEGKTKLGKPRTKVSCSILNYISITDENPPNKDGVQGIQFDKYESSRGSPYGAVLDEIEDTLPSNPRHGKKTQLSLSRFESLRRRKKCRLAAKNPCDGAMMSCLDVDDTDGSSNDAEVNPDNPVCISKECNGGARVLDMCEDEPTFQSTHKSVGSPVGSLPYNDIACVICHTEKIVSSEGLLICGHRFCFSCIYKWALESSSKAPTCPLCKSLIDVITKRSKKVGIDGGNLGFQNSQTQYEETLVMVGSDDKWDADHPGDINDNVATCVLCGIGDMDELLLKCGGCGRQSAHTFCLDPPLPPVPFTSWFCGRCSQRRRVHTDWWYHLHSFGRRLD